MNLDWNAIKENLGKLGVSWQQRPVEDALSGYIGECGYDTHPMIVNLESMETVNADLGVIVTHKDIQTNNGVYIFVVLKDHTQGLITVLPSTVSKGPAIRKVAGDFTNALLGVEHPPLTPFDMVEITGQILVNTFLKDIMIAYNIPKEKERQFLCMYLPKFLVEVAYYYTGASDQDGKPLVTEEIADMEPAIIRQALVEGSFPDVFQEPDKEKPEAEVKETEG